MTVAAGGPPSPCTGVCRMGNGTCLGCGRTIDEIATWPAATPARKAAILERLARAAGLAEDGGDGREERA